MESKQRVNILTIDDDVEFNLLFKTQMAKRGYNVTTTTSVREFSEKLKKELPDLCVIDLNLNESQGAGFQLVRAIRKHYGRDLVIFCMSRRNSGEDIAYAFDVGVDDYITKPLDVVFLLSKISQHVKKESRSETHRFNFFDLPAAKSNITMTANFEIDSIDEYGITLCSPHFISKGTLVKIKGSIIQDLTQTSDEISLVATKIYLDAATGYFHTFVEFDSVDQAFYSRIRTWIDSKSWKQ